MSEQVNSFIERKAGMIRKALKGGKWMNRQQLIKATGKWETGLHLFGSVIHSIREELITNDSSAITLLSGLKKNVKVSLKNNKS